MKADAATESWTQAREIHYEETNWRARPEFSSDGTRLVYASYLGRAWHQLWTMPAAGGDAFPLTYGEYDNTAPRWSPNGKSLVVARRDSTSDAILLRDASAVPQ